MAAKTQAQLCAYEQQEKTRSMTIVNDIDKAFQHPGLYNGSYKKYEPISSEDREVYPAQSEKVQKDAIADLQTVRGLFHKLWDLEATKDATNSKARANIEVDGKTIAENVPATTLLYLSKRLDDFHTLVKRAPVLDSAENWQWDNAVSLWKSEEVQKSRPKKVTKALQLTPTTKEHPGTAQVITEDVPVGHWFETKHSASLRPDVKAKLLENINELSKAVMYAREQANTTAIEEVKIGQGLLNYLFNNVKLDYEEAENKAQA